MAIVSVLFSIGFMFFCFTADDVISGVFGMFYLGMILYAGIIHPLMEQQKREARRQFAKERRKQREAENNTNSSQS